MPRFTPQIAQFLAKRRGVSEWWELRKLRPRLVQEGSLRDWPYRPVGREAGSGPLHRPYGTNEKIETDENFPLCWKSPRIPRRPPTLRAGHDERSVQLEVDRGSGGQFGG